MMIHLNLNVKKNVCYMFMKIMVLLCSIHLILIFCTEPKHCFRKQVYWCASHPWKPPTLVYHFHNNLVLVNVDWCGEEGNIKIFV
jgi:hypothetical protein